MFMEFIKMLKRKYVTRKSAGRNFVNPDIKDLTAWIMWDTSIRECTNDFNCSKCKDKTDCNKNYMTDLDAELKFKDCNNNIAYNFDLKYSSETERFIKNNIGKIDILIDEMKKFKKSYIEKIKILRDNIKRIEELDNNPKKVKVKK